ncbi:MAG: PilZ domain-containing protein [Desulfobacteraceae bacterium]|nr:PilZ domain-containing protein [Desulfobacteraceae bacterium]
MGEESLDFYDLEGSDLNSATRQFFRVSVDGYEKYYVKIDQKNYSLVDISVNGVCFYVDSGKKFPIGTIISGCNLNLNRDSISDLKGRVIHNSSESVNSDHDIGTKWLCGLIWNNLSSKKGKLIESSFEVLKKDILV